MSVIQTTADISSKNESTANILPVWNFDNGIVTDQNGFYNHFKVRSSTVDVYLTDKVYRGESGRSMKLVYDKQNEGFCGVWFHLFDDENASLKKKYIDVSKHRYLSFWVKGKVGNENFSIQMADPLWLQREDSKSAGYATDYLNGGITTDWQEIVVPCEAFGLYNTKASCFVLNFTITGQGTVYIDDINFKSSRETSVPISKPIVKNRKKQQHSAKAMWVWDIHTLLKNNRYQDDFFDFCVTKKITELFLQIPYKFENDLTEDVICIIQHPKKLRSFIKRATSNNILVHALDGYPEFVLKEHHPRVLAQVKAVIAFNKESAKNEQFYGIHLDNEPYQLLGFERAASQKILKQYLKLNEKVMALLKERKSNIVYGVDIPFWFDESFNADGTPTYELKFNGKVKDAAKHIIDIVDNVGIMDYRNFAGGADGIIRHGLGELKYAEKVGRQIYIGVETFKYKPKTVSFIFADRNRESKMAIASRFENYPIRVLTSGELKLIGIAKPHEPKINDDFDITLIKLHEQYGFSPKNLIKNEEKYKASVLDAISADARYKNVDFFSISESENQESYLIGFDTTEIMLEKITFADRSIEHLEEVLDEVAYTFEEFQYFRGFAIHYYETYKAMSSKNNTR